MEGYKRKLQDKMNNFVHQVFDVAASFPRYEVYVTSSQLKRAALSIVLNYVEGYARLSIGNQRHFLRISYGSLKEVEYLIQFSTRRGYISEQKSSVLLNMADDIGAMLYTEVRNTKK